MTENDLDEDTRPEDTEDQVSPDGGDAETDASRSIRDETIAELEDELGRARARYQDYRRRVERDASRQRQLVAKELWTQVLPIIDNFSAALSALDQGQNAEQVLVGVKMIHQMMERLLEDNGVRVIASVGESFDPHLHEAISREPSSEVAPNTVMSEIQRGYRLDDLVVRPAKVTVARPEEDESDAAGPENASGN